MDANVNFLGLFGLMRDPLSTIGSLGPAVDDFVSEVELRSIAAAGCRSTADDFDSADELRSIVDEDAEDGSTDTLKVSVPGKTVFFLNRFVCLIRYVMITFSASTCSTTLTFAFAPGVLSQKTLSPG